MRFLLAGFICDVVPRLFDELGVRYGFCRVWEDPTVDPAGMAGEPSMRSTSSITLAKCRSTVTSSPAISDRGRLCVLRSKGYKCWIGFHSFRKISPVTDGGLVRPTVALDERLIEPSEAKFEAVKAHAKRIKWEYLQQSGRDEALYLRGFEQGEALLDAQATVHRVSRAGLVQVLDFPRRRNDELRVRRRNFAVLERLLGIWVVPLMTRHPCLCVLQVDRHGGLRECLWHRRIYLPRGFDTPLYRRIISIPVDSRYGEAEMRRVAETIVALQARP